MLHAVSHFFGIDTQQSPFYDFWSGVATQATVVGSAIGIYRHKNCHVKRCWRLGHPDPKHGHPACRKHHSRAEALGSAQPKAPREAQ